MNVRSKAMISSHVRRRAGAGDGGSRAVDREAGDVDAGPDQAGSGQARGDDAGDAEAGHRQAGDRQAATAKPAAPNAALRTPAKLKDVAPATFRANFETSVGVFVVEVTRAWAPRGADRFYNLVKYGYFDGNRFFRVVPNFMVQFGINGDPKLNAVWSEAEHHRRSGHAEQQARVRHVRQDAGPELALDAGLHQLQGQRRSRRAGVRAVRSGRDRHGGRRQDQRRVRRAARVRAQIQSQGNAYLTKAFPRLDYIKKATIEKPAPPPPTAGAEASASPPAKK